MVVTVYCDQCIITICIDSDWQYVTINKSYYPPIHPLNKSYYPPIHPLVYSIDWLLIWIWIEQFKY